MNKQKISFKTRRIINYILFSILLCFIFLFQNAYKSFALFVEAPESLESSNLIKRTIEQEETHLFFIELKKDEILQLKISKRDLQFSIDIKDQSKEQISSGIYKRYGDVIYTFIAPENGKYFIAIQSLEKSSQKRTYELKINKKYPASKKDHILIEGEKFFQKGEQLRSDWTHESLTLALEAYQKAIELWQSKKQWNRVADGYEQIAGIYLVFGNYQDSLKLFNKAYLFNRLVNSKRNELMNFCNMIEIYILIGDADNARKYLDKVETQIKKITRGEDENLLMATLYERQGEFLALKGNLKDAREKFKAALKIWNYLNDRRGQAFANLNLGYMNIDSGEGIAAEKDFTEARKLWQELGDKRGEALTLTALGHLESFLDDWESALNLHIQAQETFARLGDRQSEAVAFNGIGYVHEVLGQERDAINSYHRALEINQEIGNQAYSAITALALARAYRQGNHFEQSRIYYEMSLNISNELKMDRLRFYVLTDLAELEGKLEYALIIQQKSVPYYENIKDFLGKAAALNLIGTIYLRENKIELAEEKYLEAYKINKDLNYGIGLSDSLYHLADVELKRGNFDKSLSFIRDSIAKSEELRTRLLSSTLKIAYRSTFQKKIQLKVEALMLKYRENPQPSLMIEAFETVEQSRAHSLLEILNTSNIEPGISIEPDLYKQKKELLNKISIKTEEQLALQSSSPTDIRLKAINREIDDLTADYEQLETKINSESSPNRSFAQPEPIRLKEIQSLLGNEETVYLNYFLGENNIYLWLVTPNSINVFELTDTNTLEISAQEFYQILTARLNQNGERDLQRYKDSLNSFCDEGKHLTRLLLAPVADRIAGKRLLVSSDGVLQNIPLDALPAPAQPDQSESGCRVDNNLLDYSPLMLTNEVVYIPSFSILKTLREAREKQQIIPQTSLAIWANPVYRPENVNKDKIQSDDSNEDQFNTSSETQPDLQPLDNTDLEAKEIAGQWTSDKVSVFTGFDVNRKDLIANDAGKYRFLHFATHGFFNSLHPQNSGLILSRFDRNGRRIRSILTVQDISQMRLNADVVVLSACQTGLGEDFSGEGVTGLKYALFSAGAKSAVVSLWQVNDDTTRILMEEFYKRLLNEKITTSAALRYAKLKVFNDKGHQEPYFWASFNLHGDYLITAPPEYRFSYYGFRIWLIIFLTLILVGGFTYVICVKLKKIRSKS